MTGKLAKERAKAQRASRNENRAIKREAELRNRLKIVSMQRDELLAALIYVIDDLELRASMKWDEDERDVVDIGNGAYMQAKSAIANAKGNQ